MVDPTVVLGKPSPPAAWLVIRSGKQVGRDYRLGVQTTIGRDGLVCDLVMDDDSVSAQHARIKEERGQFVLYDLASTNGTLLNGKRIERSALVDGDIIGIGNTKLAFKEIKSSGG
jgi:pSer/pThr/pTyr-binding forkhead associated (FHA) protein